MRKIGVDRCYHGLTAIEVIQALLDAGECGELWWRDSDGCGFDADMGCFCKGLEEMTKYLRKKLRIPEVEE